MIVVRSDDYPGDLHPGYWALVIDGWNTESQARAGCASVGRELGPCYAKRIDGSPAQ